jgi:hypothetical protein
MFGGAVLWLNPQAGSSRFGSSVADADGCSGVNDIDWHNMFGRSWCTATLCALQVVLHGIACHYQH